MPTLTARVIDLSLWIQQIPAPTFEEAARALFVAEQFTSEGLTDVAIDALGNVFARLPGTDPSARPLVVSAHTDTVFPAGTPLDVRREPGRICGPGIGDNSVAVAGLFGLLWMLRERTIALPGDLWLAANVREEGLGDLQGMRAVVDRFGDRPAAYLILEGAALGSIFHRGLCVRRARISFQTEGGHSWGDFGRPSAIHELARFIVAVGALDLPASPRTSYNVGIIEGGTSVNTIAAQASLLLDLRSESSDVLEDIFRRVENLAAGLRSETLGVRLEVIGDRPGGEIPADHPLVRLAETSLRALDVLPRLKIGSTDANVPLSRGLPAICIGLTEGGEVHTTGEYILTGPLETGLQHLLDVVTGVYRI